MTLCYALIMSLNFFLELCGIVWNWVKFVQNCVDFQIHWNLSGEELNWNVAWK